MKLQAFMTEQDVNADPPRAPDFIMWAPPHGAAVECPNLFTAQRAAELFAGKHPGTTVAVYQLCGFAHKPVEEPEFTPAGPGAEAEVIVGKAEELAIGHQEVGEK